MSKYDDQPLDAEIKFKVPGAMKEDFQVACIRAKVDMSAVLREAIEAFLSATE